MSFGNVVKDGSGAAYWLLVDTEGRQIIVGPAAHDAAAAGSPVRAGGVYHSSDPTGADGDILDLLADVAGRLKVAGAAAEDAAVVGAPVHVGGRYDAAARTLDDGDVGGVALDAAGRPLVVGPAAEDAAVVGAPVHVGGRYDATPRTLDDGDVGGVAVDAAGRPQVVGAAAEDAAVAGAPVLVGGRYDAAARDLDDGDVGAVALDDLARMFVSLGWTPSLQADEAVDDSDKSFTVPANTEWRVKWIWVEYISSGDAGNRQLAVDIQDGAADVIAQVRTGLVQAASITRYYLFAPHVTELTAFRDTDYLSTIMPEWILPAGYVVRVWDKDAIAAAADDVVIQLMVEARTV